MTHWFTIGHHGLTHWECYIIVSPLASHIDSWYSLCVDLFRKQLHEIITIILNAFLQLFGINLQSSTKSTSGKAVRMRSIIFFLVAGWAKWTVLIYLYKWKSRDIISGEQRGYSTGPPQSIHLPVSKNASISGIVWND